jgi:myo-inositol-1(or 4)-monophosphatase
MADLLELAELAAVRGGELVAGEPTPPAESKGAGDYVTEVDRASERAIREVLGAATPDIPVLGEEGGGEAGGAVGKRYWVVDPLDGTTNNPHGFPVVGVSVAWRMEGPPWASSMPRSWARRT